MIGNRERLFCFALFVIILLASCGSSKSSTSEQTHATRTDSAASQYAAYYLSRLDLARLIESNTSRVVTLRMYDTSKPADPATGLPPVFADATVNESNTTKTDEHLQKADSANATAAAVSVASAELNRDKQVIKNRDESTQTKQAAGFVWALVGLGVVAIIGYFVYKSKAVIKPP